MRMGYVFRLGCIDWRMWEKDMRKNMLKISFCLLLALALCFSEFVPLLDNADLSAFAAGEVENAPIEQSEGVVRPEEIDEGLSLNSLDDIRGRRVTVRQPIMEVLEDNIVRKSVPVMSDEYEMLSFETGEPLHDLARIDFGSDDSLEAGNKDHPMYPMRGLSRSPKDSDGKVTEQLYFSRFTKYMLLRQAYYFNTHVEEIIRDGKLAKHPAADYIYGKIPAEAKAVKMHIVTDPIYRSPMTTGLYMAPGELVTVKIKGLKAGETVTLYTHHQDTMGYLGYDETGKGFGSMDAYLGYWDKKIVEEAERADSTGTEPRFDQLDYGLHGQWEWQNEKVPCMGTTFNIVGTGYDTEVQIGSMYGGPLYIKPTNDAVDLEITGAVLTPHFVLGVTTVEEFDEQLRNAPGLIATLDVENGQLIGPAEDMRKCDDIEKLAYFWHSVFAIDISLNGRDYNYNMTMCYDIHVPAGEAVALNSNFCAQPTYWFPICMNYETLTTKGNWGTFHELGHVQARTYGVNWGFCDGDGEVWNNTLILLIYSMLCNMDSRVIGVEHGEYVHPFTAVERSQSITQEYTDKAGEVHEIEDYGQINEGKGAHFDQLSMYATLLHSFGPEKFVDMFYTYKMDPAYCANKRADFVYRIGVVDRVNILDWVNENYFANISDSMFTDSQLEFLQNLPDFVPVAYRWANGIDGNETARKYDVDGKHETVFDLSEGNISSPKPVEIVDVSDARHGHAVYDRDAQTVTYTPPAEVTEYDRFDIIVKTEGGRRVTLNVNMRLVYRGMYGQVWNMGSKSDWGNKNPTVDQVRQRAQNEDYEYTLTSPSAGVEFTHNNIEYLHLQLKYRVNQSGNYGFYVKADDAAEVTFYVGNMSGRELGKVSVTHDTTSFTAYPHLDTTLTEGETVFVDCHLVNWGGKGHMTVGVLAPDSEEIVPLPAEQIISAGVEDSELATVDSFKGWQPQFVDSIKNATIDYKTSNSGWQVLTAPISENGLDGSKLVDGDESTIYHSRYNGSKVDPPHVFVIDTLVDHPFNYFEFVRRTNGNDKLIAFQLYGCTEADFSSEMVEGTSTEGWTPLFDGYSTNVNAARQRISFPRTLIRYFKFIVTDNNGGHTVLREVYAGVESKLSQTVKPANYRTGKEGFTENSANGKISATAANAYYEFQFLGNGFELYADTHPDYGRASVTVDGASVGVINLADTPLFNKRVFDSNEMDEPMDTAVHNVVVTTLDDKPFNISFINVNYGTPVAAAEYPADTDDDGNPDYGDERVARQFSREWKTVVKDYKDLTSIRFLHEAPEGYKDTYVRIDTYIRLYRDGSRIAFVYPGTILAPIECGSLFSGCKALEELDLDNFDTTYMRGATNMFYDCGSLQSLDLSGVDTESVLSYGKMFGNCTGLDNIDLSAFKLDAHANLYRMFDNCIELQQITLPDTIEGDISVDLPYVYLDTVTRQYTYKATLDASMAGHVLTLHKYHVFSEPVHPIVNAQCLENGVVSYRTCATCGCNFEPESDTLLRPADMVIPATGHSYKYYWPEDPNAYPTCLTSGQGGTYECEYCHDVQEDIGSTSALGHWYALNAEYGGGKGYTIDFGADGKATVTFYLKCQSFTSWLEMTEENRCNHEATAVFVFDCDTHQEVTCLEDEVFFYDFEVSENMIGQYFKEYGDPDDLFGEIATFEKLTVHDTILGEEAHGHELETVKEVSATCLAYGSTAGKKCMVCEYTEGIRPIDPVGHRFEKRDRLEPTCTEAGHTEGKVCVRCGEVGEGVERLEPLDHDFSVDIPEELPTCTKVGRTPGKKCSRCEAIEGWDLVDDLGHTEEVVPGKAPTETESGLTDGLRCSVCGEILEVQQEIPPLGVTVVPEQPELPGQPVQPDATEEQGLTTGAWIAIGVSAAVATGGGSTGLVFLLRRRRRIRLSKD